MSRIMKSMFAILLASLLVFTNGIRAFTNVYAESEVQTIWTDFGHKPTDDVNKEWKITFSQDVDKTSVNNENIYVHDASGANMEIDIKVENNLVEFSPKNPYQKGHAYTAFIGSDIKSVIGTSLGTGVKFDFTVETGSTEPTLPEPKIGTPVVYPSSSVPVGYAEEGFRLVVPLPVAQSELAVYDEVSEQSSVILSYLTDENKWETIGLLFDSGELEEHSDEISGDGFYSINLLNKVDTASAKNMTLKIEAELSSGKTLTAGGTLQIIETSNGENVKEIMQVSTEVEQQIQQYAETHNNLSVVEVEEFVTENLLGQESVESVTSESEGVLEITYATGLRSMIQIVKEEDAVAGIRSISAGEMVSEPVQRVVGNELRAQRENNSRIPIEEQTTGDNIEIEFPLRLMQDSSPTEVSSENEIASRSVLLWAPFSNEFAPWNEEDKLEELFKGSPLGFNVVKKKNTAADVESLKNMTDYGFVLLSTHGSGGKWILTGEAATNYEKYEVEQILGQIAITQHMIVTSNNGVKVSAPAYAVNDKWFEQHLTGTFNNTVIFNSSCESTNTDSLWNAFSAKGAGAYYGFNGLVTSKFATEQSIKVVSNLIANQTTGNAFIPQKDPYGSYKAEIQLKGNVNLAYAGNTDQNSNLINGNFENQLTGWQTEGDGRVISGMGSPKIVSPVEGQGMAVISTGLGYTTALGRIQQTFYLSPEASTLSFNWNYLSEEFLEFIGSGYDDPFTVTLSTQDGTDDTILHLTINDIAKQFGAVYANQYYGSDYYSYGGNLIPVSPVIQFDQGDVWMTDWQYNEYVIPQQFKGKTVTLTFMAVDAGDTILDTTVLLDDIRVK